MHTDEKLPEQIKAWAGFFFLEKVYLAVRLYTGDRVEFSGYGSKKSTIASEADDLERCTIAKW